MTDPITIAVLQNRLSAIAEEMGEAMLRTAYSQLDFAHFPLNDWSP
jgi:N-methylhydantoinase B